MPIPETTDVGELIRFFKKDKPDAEHNQVVAMAINVAKKNRAKLKEQEKKASVKFNTTEEEDKNAPQTGPEAIAYALSKIDMDQVRKEAIATIKEGKKTKRSTAVALLRIAEGMERNNQTPSDYMISAVPVIPPKFRPFSAMGGSFIPGDANVLYKDLWDLMEAHNLERNMFGDKHSGQSRLDLYDAVKSVYGHGDAVKPKTKAKDIQGFLKVLTGKSAKFSYVQRKMLSKNQDSTGRSTVIVEPEYGIDEIGIPEKMAFKMYAPYIQRRLRMSGMSDAEALKHTKDKDDVARRALEKEMEERPVVYSRAPAWHKFSILGGRPHLIEGSAIKTNPYVAGGLSMDYDGDAHVGRVRLFVDTEALTPNMTQYLKKYILQTPNPAVTLSQYGITTVDNNDMFKNLKTIIKDKNMAALTIDLEEFPHGELHNVVKNDNYDIEFYTVPDGIYVTAYDESNATPCLAKVAYWSKHRGKEVEIVKLENGAEIYTDNDPRAVYGIAFDSDNLTPQRFTPTEALKRDVMVPCTSRIVIDEADCYKYYNINTLTLEMTPTDNFSIPLNYEFGQFLGCMAGDGWAGAHKLDTFHLSDLSEYNATFVLEFLHKYVSPDATVSKQRFFKGETGRYGDTIRHSFRNCHVGIMCKMITHLLGGHRDEHTSGAANKHLPEWVNCAPREFRSGVVNGYIATDGSVSISMAKGKPQLMIGASSTSLRLLREVKSLLHTLDVPSSISFSKITTANNEAWQLGISTVYAKRTGLLENCCHIEKAATFREVDVADNAITARGDTVPYPKCVHEVILKNTTNWRINDAQRAKFEGTDEEWQLRVTETAISGSVYENINKRSITRAAARKQLAWLHFADERRKHILADSRALLEKLKEKHGDANRIPISPKDAAQLLEGANARFEQSEARTKLRRWITNCGLSRNNHTATRAVFNSICEAMDGPAYSVFESYPELVAWEVYIVHGPMYWSKVDTVECTGKVEVGYDLTVPGYETFVNSDGVVLSNTINVHVPASPAAVRETKEKLMPSTFPFSNRNQDSLVPLPKQEQVLGLYTAATAPSTPPVDFPSEEAALQAIRSGQIPLSADITIRGKA